MWRDQRIDELADIVSGGTPSREIAEYWGGDIAWVTPSDITKCQGNYLSITEEKITQLGLRNSSAKMLPKGTVLFTSRATIGESRLATKEVCTNQGFKSLISNPGTDSRFLYYSVLLNVSKFKRYAIGSTFPEINKKDMARVKISIPVAPEEQQKISDVIESADKAIEKTKALIAKYENIKQGMMQDLFTRGVDENGQLRPSYEDAPHLYQETELGWIPKDWKFSSLDGVAPLVTSGSRDWARFYADFGDVFVRIGNLTREHVNFRMQNLQHVALGDNKEGTRTKLLENDILISITADLGIIGIVPDWNFDAYINQHIALVRADSSLVEPRYLAHYLASSLGRKQFEMLNDSGAKAGLNLPTIRSLKCYLPDGDEQKSIYQALDSADTNVAKARNDLEKLKSIKLGLMQDLLTGKVRVAEDMDERKEAVA